MACETCPNGDLTTITFGTSGWSALYTKIGGPEITRQVIDLDVLGEETCKKKCPGDKIDYGEFELEWCFDPDEHPPFDQDPEEVIITWPPKPTQTNGATLTGTAFFRRYKVPDASPNVKMVGAGTVVFDCSDTPTFADGS